MSMHSENISLYKYKLDIDLLPIFPKLFLCLKCVVHVAEVLEHKL